MPIGNDDADVEYERSRRRDREYLDEGLATQAFDDFLAQAQAENQQAAQAAPEAPASPNAAPEPPVAPVVDPVEAELAPELFSLGDVATGLVRGPFAELADVADNIRDMQKRLAVAVMGPSDNPGSVAFAGPDTRGNTGARENFDANAGTPDTLSGELAQGISGQLAFIIPAFRAMKGASVLGNWSKLTAVSAAVAGVTQGENEGNLSNLAISKGEGTIFDNFLTRRLAINEDDSTFERMAKAAVEDLALSFAADATIETVKGGWRAWRNWHKAAPNIKAAAARSGVEVDDTIVEAVDELADAKNAANLAQAASENIMNGRGAAAEAAQQADEVAAFKGDATGAAPAAADASTEAIAARAAADLDKANLRVQEAEARVQELAKSPAPGVTREILDSPESFRFHAASARDAQKIRERGLAPGSYFAKRPDETLSFAPDAEDTVVFVVRADQIEPSAASADDVFGQEFIKAGIYERAGNTLVPVAEVPARVARRDAISPPSGILPPAMRRALESQKGVDGRVLEALRQETIGILEARTNRQLGIAATRNMPPIPEPAPKTMLGNYLEVTEETADLVAAAAKSGDIEGFERALGSVYDNTNYDRIAQDGIEDLLRANAAVYGHTANSQRLQRVIGLAETEEEATAMVARLAEESGGSVERVIKAFDDLLPDMTDIRTRFNAFRMVEVGLASKVKELLSLHGTDAWGDLQRAEFVRWSALLSNVNDRRSGLASAFGGVLQANRINVATGNFDDILASGRAAREEQLMEILKKGGGADRIDQLAHLAKLAGENGRDALIKQSRLVNRAFTLGDVAYESFIMNILSGPRTQVVNISSNALRGALWDPTRRAFEASAVAIVEADPSAFKVVTAHIEGMMSGLTGAFRYNAKLGRSQIGHAWATGRRVTGLKGGLFTEAVPEQSLLNTSALGDLFRRGVPVRLPFTSAFSKEGTDLPLLGFIPQGARNSVADFTALRAGPVMKGLDYLGRVMQWPGKGLSAFDELFASMAYRAELYASTVDAARGKGLRGAELAGEVDRLRRLVGDLDSITHTMDRADEGAVAMVRELDQLRQDALKYADRSTYASRGGKLNSAVEQFRDALPSVRWFAPFVKTPLNLAQQGVMDFSPLGPAAQALHAASKGDPKEAAKALGRLTMVGGIYAGVWQGIQSGTITGGGPHNPDQRATWLLHHKPYSIKFAGEWYSYNRFDPLAMPIGALADMVYLQGRLGADEEDKLHEQMIGVLMEATKSRTFLQGISELMEFIEDPTGANGNRLIVSKAANLIPGSRLFSSIERGGLPVPEDLVVPNEGDSEGTKLFKEFLAGRPERNLTDTSSGFAVQLLSTVHGDLPAGMAEGWEKVWNSVLSAENQLSRVPQRDFYGEVINTPPGWGPDFASPFQVLPDGEDPVSEELARLEYGFSVKRRFGELYGLKLNPEQQDRFHRYFAKPTKDSQTIRELLSTVMLGEDGKLSDDWQKLGDPVRDAKGGKKEVIDKLVGKRMEAAKKLMILNDPEVREAFERERNDKKLTRSQEGSDLARQTGGSTTELLKALRP